MVNCSVLSCKNRSVNKSKRDSVSYFLYPKNPAVKLEWIIATGRVDWIPPTSSVMCSKHFTPECFYQSGRSCRIYPTAVPTLNLPPQFQILNEEVETPDPIRAEESIQNVFDTEGSPNMSPQPDTDLEESIRDVSDTEGSPNMSPEPGTFRDMDFSLEPTASAVSSYERPSTAASFLSTFLSTEHECLSESEADTSKISRRPSTSLDSSTEYNFDEVLEDDTLRERKLKYYIKHMKYKQSEALRELKVLRQQKRRDKRKIDKLESLLKLLQDKQSEG